MCSYFPKVALINAQGASVVRLNLAGWICVTHYRRSESGSLDLLSLLKLRHIWPTASVRWIFPPMYQLVAYVRYSAIVGIFIF